MAAVLYEGGLILNSLNMKKINLFFIMILLLSIIGKGSGLQYMSNFKFEDLVFGEDNLVKDYVTLANDPKANFPDTFTVCSSLFVKFFATDNDIITMLKEDGTPWITLTMRVIGMKTLKVSQRCMYRMYQSMLVFNTFTTQLSLSSPTLGITFVWVWTLHQDS